MSNCVPIQVHIFYNYNNDDHYRLTVITFWSSDYYNYKFNHGLMQGFSSGGDIHFLNKIKRRYKGIEVPNVSRG